MTTNKKKPMTFAAWTKILDARAERARACAHLYGQKKTLLEVGLAMNLTKERVRQLLAEGHRRGWITIRGRSNARRAVRKQVEAYGLAGYLARHPRCSTLTELAKTLKTSEETLARMLTKAELRLIAQIFATRGDTRSG